MESRYLLRSLEHVSTKPISSIGTFVSLDGEGLIAGSSDRNIRFLDVETLDELKKCKVSKKIVNLVAISQMGLEGEDPIIVTGGKDSTVQVWNPMDGSVEHSFELPTNEVRSLSIYQGSETLLVVGTKDSLVLVWDLKRNALVCRCVGHKASVHCVSITSSVMDLENQYDMDYICLVSGGADRTVRSWDIFTGKKRKKYRHSRSIATMVVAYRGIRPILATGGVDRSINLWDIETGVLLRKLEGHLDQINSLILWEGYQTLIISGSNDHTIRVFDILTGECICILVGHTEAVLGLTIADYEDPKIISISEDLSVKQWSLRDIIEDYFIMEGDYLGCRNSMEPFLPDINYVAPAELDRTKLSKEERKKIRKELKRNKRNKLLKAAKKNGKGTATTTDESEDNTNYAKDLIEFINDDDDDDDDDDDLDFLQDKDDDGEDIVVPLKPKSRSSSYIQSNDSSNNQNIVHSPFGGGSSDPYYEGTTIYDKKSNGVTMESNAEAAEQLSETSSYMIKSNSKSIDLSSTPSNGQTVNHQRNYPSNRSSSFDSPSRNNSSKVLPFAAESINSPPKPNGIIKNTSFKNLLQHIMGSSHSVKSIVPQSEANEQDQTSNSPLDALFANHITIDTNDRTMNNGFSLDKNGPSNHSPMVSLSADHTPRDARHLKHDHVVHDRVLATVAQNQYSIATLEIQMEQERLRSKAAAKLAQRLNVKKSNNTNDNPPVNDEPVVEEGGETVGPEGNGDDKAVHLATKAEKLKQHRMQDARLRKSMLLAKERSSMALQRRLDELAMKKQQETDLQKPVRKLSISSPAKSFQARKKLASFDENDGSDDEGNDCA